MRQLIFPALKTWLPQMESNHLPVGYQPTARPESLAAMGPSGRLELPCQPYQSCGSPSILAGNNYGADGDARNPNLSLTKRAFFLLNYIGESLGPRPRV